MNFFRVYIEITNICGLNCSFCPPKSAKPMVMDIALFESILKQIKTKEIALHVMGDPLLNKNLKQYLELAQKYDIKVFLVTSGFFIEKHEFSTLLHESISQLNISLNSFNKNSKNISLDEYLKPIFSLIDYKLQNNMDKFINLRLWNLDSVKSEKSFNEKIYKLLKEKFNVHVELKNAKESIRIAKKVRVHFDNYFEWPNLKNKIYPDSKCLGLNSQIAILSDGRVVPCCLDINANINLGNIKDFSLEEILNKSSKIAKSLKDGIPSEELCKRCSYRLRFKDTKDE